MTWNDFAPIYLVLVVTLLLLAVIGTLWLIARRMLWTTTWPPGDIHASFTAIHAPFTAMR